MPAQQSLTSFREMLNAALLDDAALEPYLPSEDGQPGGQAAPGSSRTSSQVEA